MVIYNPKNWLKPIFMFHKADTFRLLLPYMCLMFIYALGVAYWEIEYLHLSDKSWVKNIPIMHNLLGFAISMLLVFRTNTAYDRWWEGRKAWGNLMNSSRNLSIKLDSLLDIKDTDTRKFYSKMISLYPYALKDHLYAEKTRTMLDDGVALINQKHVPNQIAAMLMQRTILLQKQGKITGEQLLFLQSDLNVFVEACGVCERIKNTPIPYSYSAFIKKFVFIYAFSLPFGFVFSLGYYVAPIVTFIFYVLASLEICAEEIEDPFGKDTNDLPLEKIAANIAKSVNEIL